MQFAKQPKYTYSYQSVMVGYKDAPDVARKTAEVAQKKEQ